MFPVIAQALIPFVLNKLLKDKPAEGGKDLFQSKTTHGGLLMLVVAVLQLFGIELDAGGLAETILLVLGAALFLWGQWVRKSQIVSVAGISLIKRAVSKGK